MMHEQGIVCALALCQLRAFPPGGADSLLSTLAAQWKDKVCK